MDIRSTEWVYLREDILECDFYGLFRKYNFDAVIHLASVQSAASSSAENMILTNACVLERMLEAGPHIPKWIVASTMNVYGVPDTLPVTEASPLRSSDTNLYSVSKLAQEAVVSRFPDRSIAVLRLASVFGKGHENGIIHTMRKTLRQGEPLSLFSDGMTIKELIHVSDVAGIVSALLQTLSFGTTPLNVGYGEQKNAFEIANTLKTMLNSTSQIRRVDTKSNRDYSFYYDVTRLRGIYPQLPSLNDALCRYVEEMAS
jgi:nucleoside-diphosphate-sugar epimerase